ncbi:MAG: hypothetical protein HYW02_07140 [Deltaproteobacteria bacterium]|nr:hypothetical protein [Deltaproteobacteria bacterium]
MKQEGYAGADQEIKPFFRYHLIPQIYFFLKGFPKGSFMSVDVTDQCNLRCAHCYFFEQEQEGVTPLPDWPDVYFHVSIDGNEEAHETMRRQQGLYRLMMKNVSRPDLHVTGTMCITSINMNTIEEVLDDWRPHLKGFMFDFYTPIEGLSDELWMGWEKRDELIDQLLRLKKEKYGDFVAMPDRVLELMKSTHSKKVTDHCIFTTHGYSLTTTGGTKEKCMLGPKADCDRCGCVVPFWLHHRIEKKTILKATYHEIRRRLGHPGNGRGEA